MRIRLLFLAVVIFAAATGTHADPLFFNNTSALQNNGMTRVDLFSSPNTTLLGPQITFLVDITGTLNPGTTDTLLATYSETGGTPISQSLQIPLFGTLQPPFTLLLSFTSLAATQGTLATLRIDLLNSAPDFVIPSGPNAGQRVDSYTYSFNVSKPVPEPATLTLLGTGFSALVAAARKRKQHRKN